MSIVMAITILSIGILTSATPAVSRATVPLGVSVPRARIHEPVVRRAVRRFDVAALVISVVLAAVALFIGDIGSLVALIVQQVLIAGCYMVCRRDIIAAKQAEGWYDDVPVRLTASVQGGEQLRVPMWPYLLTAALAVGVIIYGVTWYPHMPPRVVTHAGFDGTPDAWGPKNVINVFLLPVVALFLLVLLYFTARWTAQTSTQVKPDGDAVSSRHLARVKAEQGVLLLGHMSMVMGMGMLALTVLTWHAVHGTGFACVMAAELLAPLVLIVRMQLVLRQTSRADSATVHATPSSSRVVAPGQNADSPDDDRYWKGGIFYNNPNDPNTWVPKRFGVGTTVNLATPWGKAFVIMSVVVFVAGLALPVIGSLL